ncbi:MAG: ATP-binding protein [Oscillospiraceae bacterium]|nr:ATP-binding protein [Oscillospiraceae bacterium]
MFFLFLLLEGCLLAILTSIYLLFFWATSVILEHAELKERTQLLEIQSRQYWALQEHMRQTARLRHDFRHSIRLLSALAAEEDLAGVRTHLAEYERSLAEYTPAVFCANAALNALFGYYYEMAVSAGVDTDWRIELPDPLTVSELDLAGLFGNLLENGIKGCQTLPEGERRFSLTTELRQGDSLYIVSTNTFDGHVCKRKGGYYSIRHDGHGIGLKSIAAVAEKYGGSVRFSHSDAEFFVDVVMKV